MSETFVSKSQAMSIVTVETGFGRRVIEKAMDTLAEQGRIRVYVSPDGRSIRIPRSDVDIIVKMLKGESV